MTDDMEIDAEIDDIIKAIRIINNALGPMIEVQSTHNDLIEDHITLISGLISVMIVMADATYGNREDNVAKNVRSKLLQLWTQSGGKDRVEKDKP